MAYLGYLEFPSYRTYLGFGGADTSYPIIPRPRYAILHGGYRKRPRRRIIY